MTVDCNLASMIVVNSAQALNLSYSLVIKDTTP